jgi:hypothetical protein
LLRRTTKGRPGAAHGRLSVTCYCGSTTLPVEPVAITCCFANCVVMTPSTNFPEGVILTAVGRNGDDGSSWLLLTAIHLYACERYCSVQCSTEPRERCAWSASCGSLPRSGLELVTVGCRAAECDADVKTAGLRISCTNELLRGMTNFSAESPELETRWLGDGDGQLCSATAFAGLSEALERCRL